MERPAVDSDSKSLLVFAIDSQFFAINAASVVSVIGWREPVALPGSHSTIRGVIQDRGRVVVVIEHPLAGG
ncbi:MAG: chemotaxis protein CheW, partial [Myxococcota bacterium]